MYIYVCVYIYISSNNVVSDVWHTLSKLPPCHGPAATLRLEPSGPMHLAFPSAEPRRQMPKHRLGLALMLGAVVLPLGLL